MALSQEEKEILRAGLQQGKSREEVISAIQKFRGQSRRVTDTPQTQEEGIGGIKGVAGGFTKSFLRTGRNVLGLAQGAGQRVLAGIDPTRTLEEVREETGFKTLQRGTEEFQEFEERVTPEGTAEKVGAVTGEIAQFLLPSTAVLKARKATEGLIKGTGIASRSGRLFARAGVEAAAGAGVVGLQRGDLTDKDVKTAAIISAAFPFLGAGIRGAKGIVGKGAEETGKKIQQVTIRPSARDLKDGFKIDNIQKYKVGGNLPQIIAKTEKRMNSLSDDLRKSLQGSDDTIDLSKTLEKTRSAIEKGKAKAFGENKASERVLKQIKEEITEVSEDGIVNILEANAVKRGAGRKGAWVFGSADPDAKAVERIYSKFYQILKKEIEASAPNVKKINKEISDLIPIQNAALRRLPVEQRNNIFSLTDSMALIGAAFDPAALSVLGATRLSKSGRFANVLIRAGEKMQQQKAGGPIRQRFLGPVN